MPTDAYTGLADVTLTANTTNIYLSGFSSSYRDLIVSLTWRNSGIGSAIRVQFNGNAGSYDFALIYGNVNGSIGGFNADETASRAFGVNQGPTTNWQTGTLKIYDYANASRHKYMISRHADPNGDVSYVGTRWENTSPITQVRIYDVLNQTIQAGARLQVWGRV